MTWKDLAELRERGQRPLLPLVVTTRPRSCDAFEDAGCLVVQHQPGARFPADLLHGLDVILMLTCSQAHAIAKLLRERGVRPWRCQSWCHCRAELTAFPVPACDQGEIYDAEWP